MGADPRNDDTFVQRVRTALREDGLRGVLLRGASALGLYRVLVVQERRLDERIPPPPASAAVRIDLLDASDLGDYARSRPGVRQDTVAARLASGQRCYVARSDGRIVSSCWMALTSCSTAYLHRTMKLAPGEVYLSDAYTLPAFRGQAIAHAVCLRQLQDARDAGCRVALRATVPWNIAALRAHAKSGFRPVRVLGRVGIGPWGRGYERPIRPGDAIARDIRVREARR